MLFCSFFFTFIKSFLNLYFEKKNIQRSLTKGDLILEILVHLNVTNCLRRKSEKTLDEKSTYLMKIIAFYMNKQSLKLIKKYFQSMKSQT